MRHLDPVSARRQGAESISFREKVLDAWLFNAAGEVQHAADEWLIDYNEFRPLKSLGNVPPTVFKPSVFNHEVTISDLSI